jgi:hypothetical protein
MQAAFALDWSFIVAEGVGVFVMGVLGLNMFWFASCGSLVYSFWLSVSVGGCVFALGLMSVLFYLVRFVFFSRGGDSCRSYHLGINLYALLVVLLYVFRGGRCGFCASFRFSFCCRFTWACWGMIWLDDSGSAGLLSGCSSVRGRRWWV